MAEVISTETPLCKKPMHIVQVAAFPFPSHQGSQVYVRGMAKALSARGHKVTVVAYGHGANEVGDQQDSEYEIVRTPKLFGYNNMRAGPDLVKPILDLLMVQKLASIKADIVHAHNYEAPVVAALSKLWTKTPVVYCAHNTMSEELHTYFERPVAKVIAKAFGRVLDLTVPRLAAHAIAISPDSEPVLQGLGCENVSFVPPGVDAADCAPIEPAVLDQGPWVIYAGNPDKYQDLDDLVAAMKLVPEAGLVMVSGSSLHEWQDCGLKRLKLVQTTSFEVVRSYLAASHVAALPRTKCTGYPIKLLNYLGYSLPVVAAVGAVSETPGVIRVPNHSPEKMAAAIRELLSDSAYLESSGRAGREHVLNNCSWEARARDLERVYLQVLSS